MKTVKVILVFTVLAVFAGLLLGLTAHYTQPRIEHNRNQALSAEWQELQSLVARHLEVFESNRDLGEDCQLKSVYEAATTDGYGGEMRVLVAFVNTHLVGVRVPYHRETPGYADVLEPNDWLRNFGPHMDLAEIDTVSRATITTRAVLNAVREIEVQKIRHNPNCSF